MAYIAPNSEIYLYNNIEFDNSYKDTMWFNNATEQNAYFSINKEPKYSFTSQQYTRTSRGKIRIQRIADSLYDCNYMRFKNKRISADGSSDKWFYAFITDVEYINEQVTEVTFEIDVMQTYLFDIILEDSFVIRQHSTSDNKFEHLIAEDLDCGEDYIVANGSGIEAGTVGSVYHVIKKEPDQFAVVTTKVSDGPDVNNPYGCIINKIPCVVGLIYWPIQESSFTGFKNYFDRVDRDNIVNAFAFPGELTPLVPLNAYGGAPGYSIAAYNEITMTYAGPSCPNTIDGYTPRNYKLFNYPYNLLGVSNRQGDSLEFKYELFNYNMLPTDNPTFTTHGVLLPSPFYALVPNGYRGLVEDYDTAIPLTNYPTMPISRDSFGSWLNQNRSGILTGLFANGVMRAVSGLSITAGRTGFLFDANEATGAAQIAQKQVPAVAPTPLQYSYTPGWEQKEQIVPHINSNFINGVSFAIGKYINASRMPNSVAGSFSGSGLTAGAEKFEYVFYQLQIRREYAMAIDSYFDMFGYKMNRIMPINRSSRPLWNYVKTAGCNLRNSHNNLTHIDGADSSVLSKVQSIYDSGITFWKNVVGLNVGDYSRASENSLH